MPNSKKEKAENSRTATAVKQKPDDVTFSSLQDFEEKMFPHAVAGRSLRHDGGASRTLGERLGDALARGLAGRLERT